MSEIDRGGTSPNMDDLGAVSPPPPLIDREAEVAQIRELLQAIFDQYGTDFRSYALSSLRRRLHKQLGHENLSSIKDLQVLILEDPAAMGRLLQTLTIHVTAMFRDPAFFLAFRESAVPLLRTYPYIRLWVAGCATGEEVYSLAILLEEEGLYDRCRIYATDVSDRILEKARAGIFATSLMQEYTRNYQNAGGKGSFADYYTADDDFAILRSNLRRNIVFAAHNLVGDTSFNEFHAIFCRNVMIYFDRALQDHVHGLFYDSLLTFGYLGLGRSENIRFTRHAQAYEPVHAKEKLFRKLR
jgi:chemotaxis protein methyltransferase CheR